LGVYGGAHRFFGCTPPASGPATPAQVPRYVLEAVFS
jgi:hypothetical protein